MMDEVDNSIELFLQCFYTINIITHKHCQVTSVYAHLVELPLSAVPTSDFAPRLAATRAATLPEKCGESG